MISPLFDIMLWRRPHRNVNNEAVSIAWSPDGRLLAIGSPAGSAGIWDAARGREALALNGHTEDVTGVAFSPDGRRALTSSADGTTRIWDISEAYK